MVRAQAALRRVRMSPRKARIVADLVRGRSVEEAVALLSAVPRKPAPILSKLILSAAANAGLGSDSQVDADKLFVTKITIDGGPVYKRWRPRAMGRATPIKKRTSHVNVTVETRD